MPTPIPPTEHSALAKIVNGTYLDKVEKILSARIEDDNDTITAVAQDGVKRLAVKITSSGISFKLLNPNAIKGDIAEDKRFSLSDGDGNLSFASASDIPAQLTSRLNREGGRLVADWLQQIQSAIENSEDLSQVGDRLLSLYPELQSGDLATLLAETETIAGMAGYLSAQQEDL